LLLLQLLLLLVVLLLHLLQLLLLLLLELLLSSFIRFLLFDLLLNLLLLAELLLLELLALLILFLLELLILDLVLLLELRIHGWWSRGDISRIRRPVLIDAGISWGIRWRVDRLVVRVYLLHSHRRVGRSVVRIYLLYVPGLNVLLRVHRRGPIVILNLARAICIVRNIVVDARRCNGGCRGNADGRNSCIRLRTLHFELTRFRDGNGAALIGLNGRLTLRKRKRSGRRRSLGYDLPGLQRGWRTHIAERTGAEDGLFRRSNGGRGSNHRSRSNLPAIDGY
jgi:hypothetical protein